MTGRAVVIGVGNVFRRDDGVGAAVIAELERREAVQASLITSDGEPTRLLDAWAGKELAVVVDAVLTDAPAPGRIVRTCLPADLAPAAASTHGLGIPDALRLADVLGHRPGRLVVFAVEAADVTLGLGLSPQVAAAVPAVADCVVRELAEPPGTGR